jgi:hypothetical protein
MNIIDYIWRWINLMMKLSFLIEDDILYEFDVY